MSSERLDLVGMAEVAHFIAGLRRSRIDLIRVRT
jgi:hypothetical protein